ncbi:RNA-directed DNA polymerase from mobile element jockey [Trichonephila clavipes]|nr:RNA-directed DNA polymerase from mobile element jockey [Trichonephila clavipes]
MGNVLVQRYVPIAIRRGKGPLTNAAVARMISKFEATGCLDDRPRSGRPSTRRNAAETVKDEMETVAGSSMHGEVSARAVARRTGIPYTTVWLALRRTLRCYPYKIHRHHELLPGDSVNRRAFAVWAFQKMAEDDDWLSNFCCGPTKLISRSEGLSTPTTAEFGLLKILELSWKLHCTTRKSRYGLDLPNLPLSGLFTSRKCVILVL